jgi:hypothetical protein
MSAPLPALVPIPAVRTALGFSENRSCYAALERHGVSLIRISARRICIRRDDFDKLLASAAS